MVVDALSKCGSGWRPIRSSTMRSTQPARTGQRPAEPPARNTPIAKPIPDDLWIKCPTCSGVMFREDFEKRAASARCAAIITGSIAGPAWPRWPMQALSGMGRRHGQRQSDRFCRISGKDPAAAGADRV